MASFTALTAGDTIRIRVSGHTHALTVVDVSPPTKSIGARNAACVVNAHLEVDFLPPLEAEPESAQAALLALEEVRSDERAEAGSYRYYRAKSTDANSAFQAEVIPKEGDPEIVISNSTNKPDMSNCSWKSVGSAASASASSSSAAAAASSSSGGRPRSITISPHSLGFVGVGWYYVGVYAYGKQDAVYDIVLREVVPPATSAADGMKQTTGSSVGSLSSSDPNAKLW